MDKLWVNVPEQTKVKDILNNFSNSRRVPHAFIFSGKEGVGKFNTAVQYAKILYYSYYPHLFQEVEQKISELQEPYIKLILPLPRAKGETADDGSVDKLNKDQIENIQLEIKKLIANPYHKLEIEDANTIKISSIREIKKFINIDFEYAPLRFIIILQTEIMNDQSQNALLKSLEEPPEGIFFFLITSDIDKLLPTIQSRCWIINFEPFSEKAICEILNEYYKIDLNTASIVAHFAEGSVYNALTLIEKDFYELLEITISILRFSLAKRFFSAFDQLEKLMIEKDTSELKLVIRMMKIWISDVVKNRAGIDSYYYIQYEDTLKKFNQKFQNTNLQDFYNKLDLIENYCDKNLNLNVIILNLIFETASLSLRN